VKAKLGWGAEGGGWGPYASPSLPPCTQLNLMREEESGDTGPVTLNGKSGKHGSDLFSPPLQVIFLYSFFFFFFFHIWGRVAVCTNRPPPHPPPPPPKGGGPETSQRREIITNCVKLDLPDPKGRYIPRGGLRRDQHADKTGTSPIFPVRVAVLPVTPFPTFLSNTSSCHAIFRGIHADVSTKTAEEFLSSSGYTERVNREIRR
jgi:hypothetical protein